MSAIQRECPRDSTMLQDEFRACLSVCAYRQRGDLVFCRSRLGRLNDAHTLLHTNAQDMSVIKESLDQAITGIAGGEFGGFIGYKRS